MCQQSIRVYDVKINLRKEIIKFGSFHVSSVLKEIENKSQKLNGFKKSRWGS